MNRRAAAFACHHRHRRPAGLLLLWKVRDSRLTLGLLALPPLVCTGDGDSADPPDKKALLYYNRTIVRKDFVLSTKWTLTGTFGEFCVGRAGIPANGIFLSLERNFQILSVPPPPWQKGSEKKGPRSAYDPAHSPAPFSPAAGLRQPELRYQTAVTEITAPVMKSASDPLEIEPPARYLLRCPAGRQDCGHPSCHGPPRWVPPCRGPGCPRG